MNNIYSDNSMQLVLYGGLMIALLLSSVTDLYKRRIPNLVTGPAILMALLTYGYIGGLEGFFFSLRGLSFGLVIFLVPYCLGGMGAGDVKLMSVVGAVLGWSQTLLALLFIALCGGVIALGLMISRGTTKQTMSRLLMSLLFFGAYGDAAQLKVNKEDNRDGIPYALAITGGVSLFFIYQLLDQGTLPGWAGL